MKHILIIAALAVIGLLTVAGCKKKKNDPALATVTTTVVTSITDTSALTGGSVTADGGAAVTAKGVCWDTTSTPTVALTSKTNDGTGTGSYISNIKGLLPGKMYYVRAYATNSAGTAYGAAQTFNTTTLTIPVLASITTAGVSGITHSTAICGGNISADGGFEVVARGVCWGTNFGPTIDLSSHTTNGSGTGSFTSSITGLSSGTKYYVRAYATNSAGVVYGDQLSFTTTDLLLATIGTIAISGKTTTSAVSGGNITSDGGFPVTARGVCWNTSPDPTIALATKTSNGTGIGTFSANMTGLTPGTKYYVRAYATNSAGTAYGPQLTYFTTALTVGMNYGGGRVAYILASGDPGYDLNKQHGLITTTADQSAAAWGCLGTYIPTSSNFGDGAVNTTTISSSCGAGTAARICQDYVASGFSDWYLPSADELKKLYDNRAAIGGFSTASPALYWSSSQLFDNNVATTVRFTDGTFQNWGKGSGAPFRPVRSF